MSVLPFDDRDGLIWLDGALVPWREARLHVLSHGLHYASSVFEGERAYNGRVFKLTEHSQRLIDSAALLGFTVPYSVEALNEATMAVVAANGLQDCYIRPVAWRGAERIGVAAQQTTTHVAIAAWVWPSYWDDKAKMQGISLKVASWRRPAPETAPTRSKAAGLYMICTLSKHDAMQDGYDDALMLDYRGQVAEATAANIFLVQNGVLHTPKPDCFLDGITRQTVMALARQRGYEVVERAIFPEEFAVTQEVFLTGTAAEVIPVRQIGEWAFAPGPVCRAMIDAYAAETGAATVAHAAQ